MMGRRGKEDRRTLLQRNQKYTQPIIDRELERTVKKWDFLKWNKGETSNRHIAYRKKEAAKSNPQRTK